MLRKIVLSIIAIFMLMGGSTGCREGGKVGDVVVDTAGVEGTDTGNSDEEDTGSDPPCPLDTDTASEEYFEAFIEQTNGDLLPEQLSDGDEYTYYNGTEIEIQRGNTFGVGCIDVIYISSWWCPDGVDEEGTGTYEIWANGELRSYGITCFPYSPDQTNLEDPQPYPGGSLHFRDPVPSVWIGLNGLYIAEIEAGYELH